MPIETAFHKCYPGYKLTGKGNKLWACCPFHNEKTASFYLDPFKERFYCFGCHASGDIIDLYARANNMDVNTTIKLLAGEQGISRDIGPDARRKAEAARRERQQVAEQEAALKKLVDSEYLRLIDLEGWVHVILKHIYSELDLERPAVIWALKTRPQVECYLNEFLRGTWTERLEMVAVTRGWDLWGSF